MANEIQGRPLSVLRLPEVMERTGLSRSSVYAMASTDRFPHPIKLSDRASAWIEAEVEAWIRERMSLRNQFT